MRTINKLFRFVLTLYMLFQVFEVKAQQSSSKLYINETYYPRSSNVVGFELISLHNDSTYVFVSIDLDFLECNFVHSNKYFSNGDTLILEPFRDIKGKYPIFDTKKDTTIMIPLTDIKYKYLQKNGTTLISLVENKRNKYKKVKTGWLIKKTQKYLKYEELPVNYKKKLEEFGFEFKHDKIIVPEQYRE